MLKEVKVPDGDLLIHTGDHTFKGVHKEIRNSLGDLAALPHKHKVFISGNHDFFWDPDAPFTYRSWQVKPRGETREESLKRISDLLAEFPSLTYLCDSGVEINGVKIWGSPWQPYFYDWAFNFPEYEPEATKKAKEIWGKIPADTNLLLTHTPPHGIRDNNEHDDRLGCPHLRLRIAELPALKVHCFGHIHGGYGAQPEGSILFVNAATCDENYDPINPPIVFDI